MSEKKKWPHAAAMEVANEMMEILAPVCERIVVAGSLRRMKESVSDVELLYIPAFETRQLDMFESGPFNLAEEKIGQLLRDGVLTKRPSEIGVFTWGGKNKLAIHCRTGIAVDLFSTTAENWYVSLVVRTGSKETNLRLTNGALAHGYSLLAYGAGVRNLATKEVQPARSEEDVFRLCSVPYLKPEDR